MKIASSPERDTAPNIEDGRSSALDSGLSGRLEKILGSSPFHPAVKSTVCPSGVNREGPIIPRRNVSCLYVVARVGRSPEDARNPVASPRASASAAIAGQGK